MKRALFGAILALVSLQSQEVRAPAAPVNKAEIEQVIRAYLLAHPEILLEMGQTLQQRQAAAKREQSRAAIAAHRSELLGTDGKSPVIGPSIDGAITVVEFFDFHCGYCKRVNSTMAKMMAANPDVRVVYKQLPILGESSSVAALAALAAAKQGGYLEFHNALLESAELSQAAIEAIASAQGLDVARLRRDMASDEVRAEVARVADLASALAIEATPSFVIGDELVQGALDEEGFKRLIAKARVEAVKGK